MCMFLGTVCLIALVNLSELSALSLKLEHCCLSLRPLAMQAASVLMKSLILMSKKTVTKLL